MSDPDPEVTKQAELCGGLGCAMANAAAEFISEHQDTGVSATLSALTTLLVRTAKGCISRDKLLSQVSRHWDIAEDDDEA